jgi:N-acetylneuraminic acid mutarotase
MRALAAGLFLFVGLIAASDAQTGGGEWVTLARMPTERQELSTAVLNGKIYVIAGYDGDAKPTRNVDVYNPATNTWTSVAPIPVANQHNAAAVAGGKLYAFGGLARDAFVYDPVKDSWSQVASMGSGHWAGAAAVINDKIYVAGGGAGTEVYDPATNTWTDLASMNYPRNHCAGGVIDGKFYVAAGRGTVEAETALEVYDPATNTWTVLAPMPTARSGVGAGVVNGELYIFGGEGKLGLYPHVEVYNPTTNTWRRIKDMAQPRHGIWGSVIGNRIYFLGGAVEFNINATGYSDMFVVTSKATLANISSRIKVETGNNVLIGGLIISGTGTKRIMVRALGPSVPLPGALLNPRLELYDGAGQLVAANDDWAAAPNKQEMIDSSLVPSHSSEAAILTTVPPGNYTAVVSGVNNSTGVGLVEVYDLEAGSEARLANISTRAFVQTGNDVLIGGLILSGDTARKVIFRAIGPSLARDDALADPTMELRNANGGLLAENNDWRTTQEAEIMATTIPPAHERESAIVQTLAPAAYTAIVRGVNNGTGIGVVEAYALD